MKINNFARGKPRVFRDVFQIERKVRVVTDGDLNRAFVTAAIVDRTANYTRGSARSDTPVYKRSANSRFQPGKDVVDWSSALDGANRVVKYCHSCVSRRDFNDARKLRRFDRALRRKHFGYGSIRVGEIIAHPNEKGGITQRGNFHGPIL